MIAREQAGYKRNIDNFMEDLRRIRLACHAKKKSRSVQYQLETIPKEFANVAKVLDITNASIRNPMNLSDYS